MGSARRGRLTSRRFYRQNEDAPLVVVGEKPPEGTHARAEGLAVAERVALSDAAVIRARELALQLHDPPREVRDAPAPTVESSDSLDPAPPGVEDDPPRVVHRYPQVIARHDPKRSEGDWRNGNDEGAALPVEAPEEDPERLHVTPPRNARAVERSIRKIHARERTTAGPAGGAQVVLDVGLPTSVASALMPAMATGSRPKNRHAVALRKCLRQGDPLAVYGDLMAAQRRQHYSWVARVGKARARGIPAPPPPPWINQRTSLLRYGYNERTARIIQADATAWRGCESLLAFVETLSPKAKTIIGANLRAMARAIEELEHLAGGDEITESMASRGLKVWLAKTG